MGVKQTFLDFKSSTQKLILWSLFFGLLLTFIFVVSDARHDTWWDHKSYIPNVLAAFTGFLVGVPLALVVLASLTKEREDQGTLNRVNRLSQLSWTAYRDITLGYCDIQRMDALAEQAQDVTETFLCVADIAADYPTLVDSLLNDADKDKEAVVLVEQLKEHADKFRLSVDDVVTRLGTPASTETEWAGVVSAWRTLDQYVKLQRLEQGLEWIGHGTEFELQKWMSSFSNPLIRFISLHEVRHLGPEEFPSTATMRDASNTLDEVLKMNESDRRMLFHPKNNPFQKVRADAYITGRNEALLFISDLRDKVALVEKSGWPGCSTHPIDTEKQLREGAAADYQEKLKRRIKINMDYIR